MTYLECRGASLGYDGRIVIENLNFTVSPGQFLVIVGENGSGKSTLIKGLLRLKSPLAGEIITGDGLKPTEIGYLPQQTELQRDFPASVLEVVLSGRLGRLGMRPFYNAADKKDVADKLRLMDIEDLKNRCYHDLSGGQQQRVLLARALCATGRLLLLDEPTAGLDPLASAELYQLIQKLNTECGLTVVMVSHDVRESVAAATHVLHLGRRQLFFGTAADYARSELGCAYLRGTSND